LDEDFYGRLSHLCIRLPALRDCREDLRQDWEQVWGDCRVDANLPAQAPWSDALARTLAEHPLHGNLRDLQRLAALYTAWFEPGAEIRSLEKALQKWSAAAVDSLAAEPLNSGTHEEQTRRFQAALAVRTKRQFGTWKEAAKVLDCDAKTLQRDAAFIGSTCSS
jgi:DNA-binding NtrC family response regulator